MPGDNLQPSENASLQGTGFSQSGTQTAATTQESNPWKGPEHLAQTSAGTANLAGSDQPTNVTAVILLPAVNSTNVPTEFIIVQSVATTPVNIPLEEQERLVHASQGTDDPAASYQPTNAQAAMTDDPATSYQPTNAQAAMTDDPAVSYQPTNVLTAIVLPVSKSQYAAPESLFIQQTPVPTSLPPATSSKNQQVIAGPIREPSFVPGPLPLAYGRDERPASIIPITTLATGTTGPGLLGNPPADQVGPGPIVAPAPGTSSSLDPADVQVLVARPVETFATPASEATLPSSMMFTNIHPFDFSSLESSVKRFFDQIDAQGLQLGKNHVDLLFASGIAAVAATVALEVARRKVQTPVPALAPHREGSIPYSDYP